MNKRELEKQLPLVWFLIAAVMLPAVCGCRADGKKSASIYKGVNSKTHPRVRMGSYASSTMGTNFLGPNLGPHGYRFKESEKNGIVYTCKGGFVDIAHLRKSADWTAFLAAKTFEYLMKNDAEFSFKLREPSLYYVQLTYPENWEDLPQEDKKRIARYISIRLGRYFTYTATTWHEILTWFGYKCTGLYSEFPSAFTWEDMFSNLLGTYTAVLALRDNERTFDEAMTLAIKGEFEKLGIQKRATARRASEKVRGLWFSGDLLFFVDMKRRNFDIGLDDGFITPWLVPGLSECEGAEAKSYLVPNLYFLNRYGFSIKFEIKPREWEKDKILKIVYPNRKKRKKRIQPVIHFSTIMDYIKTKAVEKYGEEVQFPF